MNKQEAERLAPMYSTNPELCAAVARAMGHNVHGIIGERCIVDFTNGMRGDFTPDLPGRDFCEALAFLHEKLRISAAHDAIEQECVEMEGEGDYQQWVCRAIEAMEPSE